MTGLTGFQPSGALTRRTLLLAGAGAAASAAIPNVAVAAGKKKKKKKRGRRTHLDRSSWEPYVGQVLETRNRGYPRVPLVLVRIADAPIARVHQSERFRQRSFTLVFRGPAGQPLTEGTHKLFLPGVGKVDLFFSNTDLGDDGWTYVSVFANSRIRQRPPRKPRPKGSKKQRTERARRRRRRYRRSARTP